MLHGPSHILLQLMYCGEGIKLRVLTTICLVALLLFGCRKPKESTEDFSVSYVFHKSDGGLLEGHRSLPSISEAPDVASQLVSEVGDASGKLLIRFRLLEGGFFFEIETDVIAGKPEGPCRMFMVAEGKRLLGSETNFVGGHKHGRVVAYYLGEGVMFEGFWDMDRRTGDWVLNYRYGGRAVSAHLRDDRFDGPVQVFDAAGEEIANGVYAAGKPIDGTFIEDPWALGRSAAEYGDYFTTQHFRCTSGVMSEAQEIQILKKVKKTASTSSGSSENLKGTG